MSEEQKQLTLSGTPKRIPKQTRFVSMRWRFLFPLAITLTIVAMIGAYMLASNLSGGVKDLESNILLQNTRTVMDSATTLYERQRAESNRIAYTIGIPEAIRARQTTSLHTLLEGMAVAANLDSIIVTDKEGVEVIGLLRTQTLDFTDYAVSTDTLMTTEPIVQAVITNKTVGVTGLLRTAEGLLLYTGSPIEFEGEFVGIALAGHRLDTTLANIQTSAVADVTLYGADSKLLQTTFDLQTIPVADLTLDIAIHNQTLTAVQQVTVPPPINIGGLPYRVAYTPFIFGPNTLGVIATFVPDNAPFATEIGRQATSLMVSAIVGAVVVMAFIGISRMTARVEKVTAVAQSLAAGQPYTRTHMTGSDEIGLMGQALDQYAESAQARQDKLRDMLRRQRREMTYVLSALESMPDGIVVQDVSGRVLLMNEHARTLLGSQRVLRTSGIQELTAVFTETMGASLAPGLYALGDPQRINLDNKMMSAQAAAIMSANQQRLGTVIVLRDITTQVREDQAREQMLSQLARDIQQPLSTLAQTGATSSSDLVKAFAREISRYSAGLQKMIVDMRELNHFDQMDTKQTRRPLRLEMLLWAVANDWRQIAQAAGITLHVIIEQKGVYVLGDERRLRWAMGNIVDNAIKYTLTGGAFTLEIKGEADGMAHLRIRDNGVGIDENELDQIFIRFYRGTPATPDGRIIRVPGMGQGLTVAQQIFEAHGGKVRIKSKVGIGTAVYLSLPVTAPVTYEMPYLDDDMMEGETMPLPEGIDIDAFWQVPQK